MWLNYCLNKRKQYFDGVTKDLKMKKAIILPVLASAMLSGCGGGSDSGSGSVPPLSMRFSLCN